MLLAVESSLFGNSIASYRRKDTEKKYVKSIFHGAYRKEVFQKAAFLTRNGRTEDNELHYRIRQAGYNRCHDLDYFLSACQKYLERNAETEIWKWILDRIDIRGLSKMFIRLSFCAVCLCYSIIGRNYIRGYCSLMPFLLLLNYGIFCLFGMISAFIDKRWNIAFLLMPVVFLTLHIAYGVGTIVGFICSETKRQKVETIM